MDRALRAEVKKAVVRGIGRFRAQSGFVPHHALLHNKARRNKNVLLGAAAAVKNLIDFPQSSAIAVENEVDVKVVVLLCICRDISFSFIAQL